MSKSAVIFCKVKYKVNLVELKEICFSRDTLAKETTIQVNFFRTTL